MFSEFLALWLKRVGDARNYHVNELVSYLEKLHKNTLKLIGHLFDRTHQDIFIKKIMDKLEEGFGNSRF